MSKPVEIPSQEAALFLKTLLNDDYGVSESTYRMLNGLFGRDKTCARILSLVETGKEDRCYLPENYAVEMG